MAPFNPPKLKPEAARRHTRLTTREQREVLSYRQPAVWLRFLDRIADPGTRITMAGIVWWDYIAPRKQQSTAEWISYLRLGDYPEPIEPATIYKWLIYLGYPHHDALARARTREKEQEAEADESTRAANRRTMTLSIADW